MFWKIDYYATDMTSGVKEKYDKLILEIWTNGTLTPDMALVEAAKILRKHLNPFVQYFDLGEERVSTEAAAAAGCSAEGFERLLYEIAADPAAAFAHMRRALKPGGRLAFCCWREFCSPATCVSSRLSWWRRSFL